MITSSSSSVFRSFLAILLAVLLVFCGSSYAQTSGLPAGNSSAEFNLISNSALGLSTGGDILSCFLESILRERHFHALEDLFSKLNFNHSLNIALGIEPVPWVWHPDVRGRVKSTAPFVDYQEVKEYLYLVSGVQSPWQQDLSTMITPLEQKMLRFYNNGSNAVALTNIGFYFDNGTLAINLTQVIEFRFLETWNGSRVIEFVADVPNLDYWWLAIGNNWMDPNYAQVARTQVCQIHEFFCVPNGYAFYSSFNDCMATMNATEMGSPSTFADDNISCRLYHGIAATLLPSFHCNHLAPDGINNACKRRTYQEWNTPLFDQPPRLIN